MIPRENIKHNFLAEAIDHGKAIAEGDNIKANKLHKKIQTLYKKAKESNQVDLFSELLNDSDENVRLWAATFSLKVFPDKAEKELLSLSNSTSIIGLSARTTLDMWKKGMLNLL
ncbi:MAG: DUF2019 domain-containing protein [Bacteroidia bacterium]|nr:DUF2019 domain-containing protein [Bacteroidia bacterium]